MKTVLRILVALPAILFVVLGLRWMVDPEASATQLGMSLMEGVGRSSQIADLGAFFLSLGMMMLIALITARRSWFHAPAIILLLAALYRVLAWLLHDAALAPDMIVVEVVVAAIVLVASSRLALRE